VAERRLPALAVHVVESDEREKARAPEARLAAHDLREALEHAASGQGHAHQRLVSVVRPHDGARAAGRAGGQVVPLEEQHAARSRPGEVPGGAGPLAPASDHDDVR